MEELSADRHRVSAAAAVAVAVATGRCAVRWRTDRTQQVERDTKLDASAAAMRRSVRA
jgi:hypothetical protein